MEYCWKVLILFNKVNIYEVGGVVMVEFVFVRYFIMVGNCCFCVVFVLSCFCGVKFVCVKFRVLNLVKYVVRIFFVI